MLFGDIVVTVKSSDFSNADAVERRHEYNLQERPFLQCESHMCHITSETL